MASSKYTSRYLTPCVWGSGVLLVIEKKYLVSMAHGNYNLMCCNLFTVNELVSLVICPDLIHL